MNNIHNNGRLRSFGRLANHMSKTQQQALDASLMPYLFKSEDLQQNHTKCVVEIGLGNGELMAARAEHEPNTLFIGNEVYKNGLKVLAGAIAAKNLSNIRLFPDDGRELLAALPKNSVDELLVLYPDPWPKSKHKKRRIINSDFLTLAGEVLTADGTLFLATDIPDYALWMLREIYTDGVFFPTAISPDQWAKQPTWWHQTKYERKALKQGRKPWYMTFKKNVDRSNTKCLPDT